MTLKNKNYQPVPLWAKLPHPMRFQEATSVATDSNDNVYVFNRGLYPLIIFDKDGNYIGHWGEGEFNRPHGIRIDKDEIVILKDSTTIAFEPPNAKFLKKELNVFIEFCNIQ